MSLSTFFLPKQRLSASYNIGDAPIILWVNSERGPRGALYARRLVLLASGVGLGAATFFAGPGGSPNTSLLAFSVAHAGENAGRTAGFADIVERVRPAVISVRVRVEGGQEMMGVEDENGSDDALGSAEGFFRRFGKPGGMIRDRTRAKGSPWARVQASSSRQTAMP